MEKPKFDSQREGTGTKEWAEVTENIQLGCINNCLYCYAAHNADRFKRRDRSDWAREELTKRADIKSYPFRDGVVMFPSSHDITTYNVDAFCRVSKLILKSGNKLLIVSKPRSGPIWQVCTELKEYKDQILFRFTIGSTDDGTLSFWEPGAPRFAERMQALAETKGRGFKTSVSAEPLLGGFGTAALLVQAVDPFVTDTIWIGKMNKIRLRVRADNKKIEEMTSIESMQTDKEMIGMYNKFKDNPKIRWKDSIKDVLAKNKIDLPRS